MTDKAPPGASHHEQGPWGGERARDGRDLRPTALAALIDRGGRLFGGGGPTGRGSPDATLWRWGVAAIVIAWLALTSIHTVNGPERGVVTRFGRYAGTLQQGLHMTLPAPIDIVRTVDVDKIHEIPIDGRSAGDEADATAAVGQNLMLTGDGNLLDLAYTVRWSVADPERYLFELADPQGTIREVAESAMREAMAGVSLSDAMGRQRGPIAARVAARMQDILDGYHAGIAIRGIAVRQADPPAEVMDAFKEVSAAQQQAQSLLNRARSYATQVNARALGDASAFDQVYEQYRLAPEVTRRRMYYETMERVLAKTDKVIVQAGVTPYLPIQPKASK